MRVVFIFENNTCVMPAEKIEEMIPKARSYKDATDFTRDHTGFVVDSN